MRSDKQDLKLKLIEMGYDEQLATVAANKYKNMDQAIAYIKSINGLSRIRQIKEADKRQVRRCNDFLRVLINVII